ncbi:MAG: pyrroloquinoline quinone-dependent dehydrogenase [Deltaproteobacteria bacterium]|nr:pyrroloquinoline quinone-dependent dehydrogenase [Deltaproteobacteria bacterium]MBW2361687.1 pyrroloquinoline quinone-dependent dehydrogenase [Deltaproteobacteria bacterium]
MSLRRQIADPTQATPRHRVRSAMSTHIWPWLLLAALACSSFRTLPADRDWSHYLGDPARTHYSPLRQIDRDNVQRLEVAWTHDTGDATARSELQCNPLIVAGVIYATSPSLRVFALDATSGAEIWSFDPFETVEGGQGRNRGLSWWADGDDRRILVTAGPWLLALDARSGTPVESFGEHGRIDLREGLDTQTNDSFVSATTPGAIWRDLYIIGTRVSEDAGAAPGHVRAYDVRTGERRWIFHTIPHPGEPGHETWPEAAWQHAGGANAWSGISIDEERGLAYFGTGSATPDFYGAARIGDDLYANSLVALDAATGERRWHFQFVHHDLWDRDVPAPPNLVTIERAGRRVDAVAQVTKSGHVFVFDRESGEPLFPIEERPAPSSAVPGEVTAPTQPVPLAPPPFTRQRFTREGVTQRTPEARASVLARVEGMRTGAWEPPGLDGAILYPGYDGGAAWGGAGWDPQSGRLFVNANEVGSFLRLLRLEGPVDGRALYLEKCGLCHAPDRRGTETGPTLIGVMERRTPHEVYATVMAGAGRMPGFPGMPMPEIAAILAHITDPEAPPAEAAADGGVRYVSAGYQDVTDPDGFPGNAPPWGTLSAIDLARGEISWQVPLGGYAALIEQGLTKTGAQNYGGPLVTAGGVLFIAATPDETLRAFDVRNGDILWEAPLPYSGFATPATYQVRGRQYIVIAAGGGKLRRPAGASYVAFALPDGTPHEGEASE